MEVKNTDIVSCHLINKAMITLERGYIIIRYSTTRGSQYNISVMAIPYFGENSMGKPSGGNIHDFII